MNAIGFETILRIELSRSSCLPSINVVKHFLNRMVAFTAAAE